MRRASLLVALASGLSTAALASAASAQVIATPCAAEPETCLEGAMRFERTKEALPLGGGFDTGWIPADSPLQVHLAAGLWSETSVVLEGDLETSWPEVLAQRAVPKLGAGSLGIHYGAEISADARFEVEVLGQQFSWEGPIPYIPQFDFQVEQLQPFDPWAFDGFTVSGATETQTLVQVSATSFVGIDIPGLDGGFQLDVQLDLDATYTTNEIVVAELDGTVVAGGTITSVDDATRADYLGTPAVEHDVRVSGSLFYEGTLHLIPAFYLEILGQDFSIPIVDIPVPFTLEDRDFDFDPVRVHTPIPDIDLPLYEESDTIAFGEVEIGEERTATIELDNVGEHVLAVRFVVDDGVPVEVPTETIQVVEDGHAVVEITYAPTDEEPLDAVIVLLSNDPDEPTRTLSLTGRSMPLPTGSGGGDASSGEGGSGGEGGGDTSGAGGADDVEGDFVASGGGCDCTTSSSSSHGGGILGALAIAGILASRRRSAQA